MEQETNQTQQLTPEQRDAAARADLATAHRVWAQAFNGLDTVRTNGPLQDDTAPQRLELLTRAVLTDAIARVCDGAPLGLARLVHDKLRAVCGDIEAAQTWNQWSEVLDRDNREQLPAQASTRQRAARAELLELRGNGKASPAAAELIDKLLSGDGHEADADKLFRMLVVDAAVGVDVARRALECATELVG